MTLLEQSRSLIMRLTDQTHLSVSPQCFGTFHPRVLLAILLALIALSTATEAQVPLVQQSVTNYNSVPVLKPMYRIIRKGGLYVPDFDTVNNGRNAFFCFSYSKRVLYTQFSGDTTNFWRDGLPISGLFLCTADLDGDGIKELIDIDKKVYVTKRKGIPHTYTNIHVENKYQATETVETIRDFDGDGREDIVYRTKNDSGYAVMWGNDSFNALKISPVVLPTNVITTYGVTINPSIVKTERIGFVGINKTILYLYNSWSTVNFSTTYGAVYICSMKREGDTLKISVADSLYDVQAYPNKPILGGSFLEDKIRGKSYWNTSETKVDKQGNKYAVTYCFELQEDGSRIDVVPPSIHPVRIRQQGLPDLIHWQQQVIVDSAATPRVTMNAIYSEYPREGVKPYCLSRPSLAYDNLETIYDVDGDGISDWSIRGDDLYIAKGVDWRTSVSVREGEITQTISIEPNSVSRTDRPMLRFSAETEMHIVVNLYTMEGRHVGMVHDGRVEAGGVELPLHLSRFPLTAGRYMVRVTAGSQSSVVPLLIQP